MSQEQMVVSIVSMAMGVGVIATLAWAYVERLKLKSGGAAGASRELKGIDDRLARMENAIDTMALEVERIAEGQRFTTKLLSDKTAPPSVSPGA